MLNECAVINDLPDSHCKDNVHVSKGAKIRVQYNQVT